MKKLYPNHNRMETKNFNPKLDATDANDSIDASLP